MTTKISRPSIRRQTLDRWSLTRLLDNPNHWVLEEIKSDSKKKELIRERNQFYMRKRIKTPTSAQSDPFDYSARFFILRENDSDKVLKSLRIVTRDNPLGLIPLELNLMDADELQHFSRAYNYPLTQSTLKPEELNHIQQLLSRNVNSGIYDIGGFFGEGNTASALALILGVTKLCYDESFSFLTQTQNPRHTRCYLDTGLPYEVIGGDSFEGYEDVCQRPATTLGIENTRAFRTFYRTSFKRIADEKLTTNT